MIRIFQHYVSKMAFMLLLLELLILLTAAVAASPLWLGGNLKQPGNPYLSALAFAGVLMLSMSALGMYQHTSRDDIRNTLLRILPSFLLGFVLLNMLVSLVPAIEFGHAGKLVFVLGAGGVLLTRLVVFTSAQSSMMVRRLILLGDGAIAHDCMELISSQAGFHQFEVIGCVPLAGAIPGATRVLASKLLVPGQSLLALARRHDVHEIVVSVNDRRNGDFPVRQLLECALGGLRITDAATFFEREACQLRVDSLRPSHLIFGGGFDQSFWRATVKRGFDLLASAIICIAALPLMLATALAIRCEDGGPVFYRQERVGKNGRGFKVLKFRSMCQAAEPDGTPQWAAANDPRVTRTGRWIRKLRIDELPQMLNVLRGEMSFVGPRPERGYFVAQLNDRVEYYNVRHSIKPGVTGLAQVRYQYGASIDDSVQNLLAALSQRADAVNQVYNVAASARTSLNQLHALLSALVRERVPGLEPAPPRHGPFRAGDVRHSHADISKAGALLGYVPTHDLRRGLCQAIPWYLAQTTMPPGPKAACP